MELSEDIGRFVSGIVEAIKDDDDEDSAQSESIHEKEQAFKDTESEDETEISSGSGDECIEQDKDIKEIAALTVDEDELKRRKKFTEMSISNELGIPVDDLELAYIKVPKTEMRHDFFGFKKDNHVVPTCEIRMKLSQHEYIIDQKNMQVPFDPPITGRNPIGLDNIEYTDDVAQTPYAVTAINEPNIINDVPLWWDDRTKFNESLATSKIVKELDDTVKSCMKSFNIETLNECSKNLLTEAVFAFKHLTKFQIIATFLALQGISFRSLGGKLQSVNKEWFITRESAKTCIKRTFHGDIYDYNIVHRESPKLGYIDSLILAAEIDLKIANHDAPDSNWVIERANNLWESRNTKAKLWLKKLNLPVTHKGKIWECFKGIVKPKFDSLWINKFCKKAGFIRREAAKLERERGIYCTAATLIRWSLQFGATIASYSDNGALLFNFDEAMITAGSNRIKFVSRKGMEAPTVSTSKEMRHMTACCCFNQKGITAPLLIVLNNPQSLPENLKDFKSEQVYFSSQANGWIDKDLFFEWAKIFCSWITDYKKAINKQGERVLLLLDSHPSRASPLAIELFRKCNVTLITFPPHCTHVLQPFDVGIAKQMKSEYTKQFNKMAKGNEELTLDEHRTYAVSSIINAWKTVVTHESAAKAFEIAGLMPFNTGTMLIAHGVNTISPLDPEKEERKHGKKLVITSCELTSDTNYSRIKLHIEQSTATSNASNKSKKVEKNQSLVFHKLDIGKIIKKSNQDIQTPSIKVKRIKGTPIDKSYDLLKGLDGTPEMNKPN